MPTTGQFASSPADDIRAIAGPFGQFITV